MIHFCPEEAAALGGLLASVPVIGLYWRRFWAWVARRRKPHCCDHTHQ